MIKLLKQCKRHLNASFPMIYRELLAKIDQVLANNKIQANTVACNKIQENK